MPVKPVDQILFIAIPYVCLFTFLLMTIHHRYRHSRSRIRACQVSSWRTITTSGQPCFLTTEFWQ